MCTFDLGGMAESEIRAWSAENGVAVCAPGQPAPLAALASWASLVIDRKQRRAEICLSEELPRAFLSWQEDYGSGQDDGGVFLWMEDGAKDASLEEWLGSLMEYAAEGSRITGVLTKGLRMWKKIAERMSYNVLDSMASHFDEIEDDCGEALLHEGDTAGLSCSKAAGDSSGQKSDVECDLRRKRKRDILSPVTPASKESVYTRQSQCASIDASRESQIGGAGSQSRQDGRAGFRIPCQVDVDDERQEGQGKEGREEGKKKVEERAKRTRKAKMEQLRAPPTTEANVALSRSFRDLQRCCKEVLAELSLVDEGDLYLWEVRLAGFPSDSALGADLAKTTDSAVVLHMSFSGAFPFEPPFVRVIRPRFKAHTGHVSNGGSLCLEVLTLTGWTPATSIESLVVAIRAAMVEGNGRVDFKSNSNYKLDRAVEGYRQLTRGHRWKPIPL